MGTPSLARAGVLLKEKLLLSRVLVCLLSPLHAIMAWFSPEAGLGWAKVRGKCLRWDPNPQSPSMCTLQMRNKSDFSFAHSVSLSKVSGTSYEL